MSDTFNQRQNSQWNSRPAPVDGRLFQTVSM